MLHEKDEQLQITTATKISEGERSRLTRWFAKQSVTVQARIEKEKKHHFYKIKNSYPELSQELQGLAANFTSIQEHYNILKNKDTKESGSNAAKKIHVRVDAMKKAKRKTKTELVLDREGDLVRLYVDEKLSYREVASYFTRYLKIDVSHVTIAKALHMLQTC